METIKTLKGYLGSLKVGRPITYENLTLFSVTDGDSQALSYLLLEEALATGKLRVVESGEGTVPELLLVNETDRMVFLMDGEALVGAKQNRTLNTSILAAANSSFSVPVSCVEQGRWAFTSREMHGGSISYPDLRKLKNRSVHESLRYSRSYRSDQGRIWQSVHAKLEAMEVRSPTANMEEAYRTHESSIQDYTNSLPYPEGACGVVAAIGGRIACADLFDSAKTLAKLWFRLVSSYAMDALEAKRLRPSRVNSSVAHPASQSTDTKTGNSTVVTEKEACEFLQIPEGAEIEAFPSPGLGSNVRIRHARRSGHALVYEGVAVHAALFGADEGSAAFEGPISRPSRRRPL